ncbi:type IX secretion system membrane protein, PorP/SprF family [Lishizhenia tianjinensis]|uniref:Type IX secretion system membrane protein, PorP/SprF family n=1 Tax=Lishizhenia tianjinensis TaxID=477690 RepID=A0A1I7BWW9_9FLAO|nr:type IX secretion system membrane protein PorP/SprF [Lishizhenia tianjinensis]SFT91686.1 type IX secretion system membrane protein, PorP/SprF family [Lishizhenia tianjinensis]
MMKKLITIPFVLLLGLVSFSQQDPMLTQYMFNGLYLNPAYAGSHKYWTSTASFRTQWVGADFNGAPRTAIAAVDGPVPGKNIGLGLILSHDEIGVTTTNAFTVNYSYQLQLNQKTKLAFGLNAGAHQMSADLTDVLIWDTEDDVYASRLNKIIPRMGAGAYLFTDKYYVGISIPTLLAYDNGNDFSLDLSQASFLRRHYLITGGVILKVSETLKFKPSTLVKYTRGAPVSFDLNFSAVYLDKFWVGTSFRAGDAMAVLLEYQSNSLWRIGYSYDITTSSLRNFQNGSHEILIGIDFGKDLIKVKTPRYF